MKKIVARVKLTGALLEDAEQKFGVEEAIKDLLDVLVDRMARDRANRRDIWGEIAKEVKKEFPEFDNEKHLMHYDWKLQIVKVEEK